MSRADQWRFLVDGDWEAVRACGRLQTNDGHALLTAARGGRGLIGLPSFITHRDRQEGLVLALEDSPLPEVGLFALSPSSARLPGRARAVVDHLDVSLKRMGC